MQRRTSRASSAQSAHRNGWLSGARKAVSRCAALPSLVLLSAFVLAGCAGLPGARTESVQGRALEFVAQPGATPVVVFENGLGAHMQWWAKVLPALPKQTAYFVYNRPGTGASEPPRTSRDAEHVGEELRAALKAVGLPPPYLLVGHSLGGLYMQWLARRYPDELAGLVLVDSTHPRQLEGAGAMDQQSAWVRGLVGALVTGTAKDELDLIPQSGRQVLALPTLSGKPVWVLSASGPMKETSALARIANEWRVDVARLYPGSHQVWVDSGHAIPMEQPETVVQAINEALASAQRVGALPRTAPR
jgi:pimeloyl-ACP methyl ester carboxylesterase